MSERAMRAVNTLRHDIIDRMRSEGATPEGAATVLTALEYVVAQVLVTWRIPVEVFADRVNAAVNATIAAENVASAAGETT